ncbi:hypothetical protein QYE76_024145 [Lolium multiflorum]|uniref:No apical meristem-associated C-terminal domain-containing protein n=1 Tax=Lolium multiflorum TaxID=4521 RepID=A0AAD8RG40_LOLMU|nr:hypothetical protein QYE76_024145 [Lolium multiflorum]
MSREEWGKEVERRSFATFDRRRRHVAAIDAAKAASTVEACLSLGGGLSNISSSPSSSGYYAGYNADGPSISQMRISQMDGHARYSPEYGDNDMTFDANAPFSRDSSGRGSGAFRFPVDLNSSPDLRRTNGHVIDDTGLLRDLFPDEGRSTHQVFGSASGVSMGEDEHTNPPVDEYEEEADEDEGEEEVHEELIDADTGVTTTTTTTRMRSSGTRGLRWRSLEDECLIEAWKQVSFFPITGANQTGTKYYKRILDCFNEKKNYGDYATINMNRNEGALSHRWNIIKAACSKFHGIYEKIKRRQESGNTMVDWILQELEVYKVKNKDKDFIFMHCFNKIQGCKKWDDLRHTLHKDGVEGPVDPAGASTGRPIGNKKAKAERNAAPVLAAMDASLEKMITSFSVENKEAADRAAVVWKAILDKQDMKIELEREKVEAAKMEAHAAAMKATNEATQLSLAKMSQESKILMANMEKMDPLARAWHEMYRERIGQEVLTARAASASPRHPPPTELPPGLADDEEVVEVEPPLTPFI